MDAVQTWSEHTVRCLREMEWQHVGYLLSDDGSMDLSKPLLRCPSCWTYSDVFRRQEHTANCMVSHSKLSQSSNQNTEVVNVHIFSFLFYIVMCNPASDISQYIVYLTFPVVTLFCLVQLSESLKFYNEILFPRLAQDPTASGLSSAVASSVSSPGKLLCLYCIQSLGSANGRCQRLLQCQLARSNELFRN